MEPLTRRRPGRPRGGVAAAGRQHLLETAERIIRADGPGVTLEDIAAAAGVTKPIVYREVGDKAALVDALAERLVDRIHAAVSAATAGAVDEREGWRRFLGAYFDVVGADPELFVFTTAAPAGVESRLLRLADRSAAPMAALTGSDDAAVTRAYAVVGMLHVVTLWWIRDASVQRDDLVEHLLGLLVHGVGGAPAPASRTPRSRHPKESRS